MELQGYKTFASRNLFEFSGAITTIVGPNGAGKSNVADSLRWVLGEQSYSLLRGRKTDDMIFAGSESRPRASMASATITFDNQDGWLPIDFSEVSISRRAYRDGQNEYLLNGQRVRLKEISELLAKSGLAERTYTIIGQGLVDAALSLKPEERRRFFEEAAGIGLYRTRREEALNRLDTTKRNLERVLDILSELEPRLHSLEKQARRVIEYEQIKADLKVLLRDWYGYHWHRGQQELLHTRETFYQQEERLGQARLRVHEVEERVGALRAKLQGVRDRLNQLHGQSAELHRQREKVSRDLAVMDERQRALQEQQNSLEADLTRLQEAEQGWKARLDTQQAELQRLQGEAQEAQRQVEAARESLNQRRQERERSERVLREARQQLTQAETRQVQTRAHQDELRHRLETLQKSRESLLAAASQEAEALRKAEQRFEEARKKAGQAETVLNLAEDELLEARQHLEKLEGDRKKILDERAHLDAERTRLRTQLDVLEQAERSFSGLNQGAKFLLEAAQKGRLQGRFRPFSSVLDVPAAYEVAVAAVLGDFLDGVLMGGENQSDQILDLLEGGKGRAVLFPERLNLSMERPELPAGEGIVGNAADLVRTTEDLSPLVEQLLGQVIVAENRGAARRAAQKLPASARVVTLRGEVFWGSGVVVAGQEARAGMIARPRQIRELQESLDLAEDQRARVQTQLERLEKELNDRRGRLQEQDKQVRAYSQALAQANQAQQQAKNEVEQARQRGEWQRKQVSGVETQITQGEAELHKIQTDLEGLTTQITSLQEGVREKVRALNSLPMEEFQAQVAHWSTGVAVALRAVGDAEKRLEEYRQSLEANERERRSLEQRSQGAAESLKTLDAEKNQLRGREAELTAQMDALQAEITPGEAELEGLEAEYTRQQGDQVAVQQALSVAERHTAQAQIELTRQRESLDSLQRRIEDDFGLVMYEYNQKVSGPTPLPLGDMVAELPTLTEIPTDLEENINRQRSLLRRMGAVNPDAAAEYQSVKERFDFLTAQVQDLHKADQDLRKVITELDELMHREFHKTFDAVAAEFKVLFTRLFGGGSARLVLTDEDNITETGIDIEARLPGRREQGLSLLSGGERSLTAVALVFSLLKVSPTPFCVMDEVDAMLDESNVGRFCELLQELSANTQFVLITHNRNTVQTADVIYGVTMGRDSASQVISLKLDEVGEDMVHS